jgi:glycosyltransferase involved in cell wall biosynthesis
MKIVWVKAGKLLPVDTGGKIRSFNILRHLASTHQVVLLSYYGGHRDHEYEAALEKSLPGAHTISTSSPDGTFSLTLDYLWRILSQAPYAVRKFTNSAVQRTIAQWLGEKKFDVAICDFLSASLNFPPQLAVPSVLFQHNVETVLWQRMAETETKAIRRLSYRVEAAKMARYEKQTLQRFHHIIAVSERDRQEMLKLDSHRPITVVPTGVDTELYHVAPPATSDPPIVTFTGSMDWEPNIDAVEYFCRQIWPTILQGFPNARFQIVGRKPHARVRHLASESVEITGMVASVAEYLRDATVVIVPLRIGGGTRLKIFEAMAMGKAVISTTIGAEGLDVVPGRDLVIADTPALFAESILQIIRDSGLRRRYEEAAATLAARYDWSKITSAFEDVLRTTIATFDAAAN